MNGKGDRNRTADHKTYRENFKGINWSKSQATEAPDQWGIDACEVCGGVDKCADNCSIMDGTLK